MSHSGDYFHVKKLKMYAPYRFIKKGQHIDYLNKEINIIILYFSQAYVWVIPVTLSSVDILSSGQNNVLTSSEGYNCLQIHFDY